jgi:hypothetical protein
MQEPPKVAGDITARNNGCNAEGKAASQPQKGLLIHSIPERYTMPSHVTRI